jgi:transcriptional regulator with XRE-family HTH domain
MAVSEVMTVADLVRTEREKRGWSIDDLASASQLARATIYRIETGETLPRGLTRRKLAQALGLPVEALRQAEEPVSSGDTPLESGAADLLRALRRVWPDLSPAQQLDLLQNALDARRKNKGNGDPVKTEAS